MTVACVQERVLISREDLTPTVEGESPAMKALTHIWTTLRTLPRPIQQILNVQVSSAIAICSALVTDYDLTVLFLDRLVSSSLLQYHVGRRDLRQDRYLLLRLRLGPDRDSRQCHSSWH